VQRIHIIRSAKSCTDLDLTLIYISRAETYGRFALENKCVAECVAERAAESFVECVVECVAECVAGCATHHPQLSQCITNVCCRVS